ncbi:MAG: GFA family protein [Loktanella sp.]|nr:GFA family protein [Loktanella sp.]
MRYAILGQPRSVVACHCSQCRKSSGHYVAATQVSKDWLKINGETNLTWYQSSETAMRGFCRTCGSQLFWIAANSNHVSVMAGTIDGASGLTMDRQIHCSDQGDYYSLPEVDTVDQSSL